MLKLRSAGSSAAYTTLFASQLAIAASGIFARFAMHSTGPIMASALRLTIASAIMLIASAATGRWTKIKRKHELMLALCGLALAVHFASWMASLCYVSVATSTLIVSTAPLWTALYDVVVMKARPSRRFWLGFVLAAIGILLFVTGTSQDQSIVHDSVDRAFGEVLAAIGGFAFAFYLIVIRKVTQHHSTLTIVTRTYSWSALFLWVAALAFREQTPGVDLQSWCGILAMALVVQMFGHTCLNASLKTFSPRIVALTTLLEPVIAALLASVIFQETLSPQMIAGALLLLIAIALVMYASMGERARQEEVGCFA